MGIVIVTGETRGIGLGITQCFLNKGYRVVLNYRQDDKQADTAFKKLNSKEAFLIKADVTINTDRKKLLSKAIEKFGKVDVLVNSAQDVASAAIYLASDEASYTTGIDIPVDGGLLC